MSQAVEAVRSYAQEVAQLPPFASDVNTTLKAVVTDAVPGAVLPRSCDVWFALRPVYDLKRNIPNDTKRDLIQKRQALLATLVTLATAPSSPYRWDALTMNCGESQGPEEATNSFWIDLMSVLSPEAAQDMTKPLAKCLIAMSRERQPRFLLRFEEDAGFKDFPELLEAFLKPDAATIEEINTVLSSCGVENRDAKEMTIEVGLSFMGGKVTHTVLTKVFEIIDRSSSGFCGIQFRVTLLRFGSNSSLQPKAMELFRQRKTRSSITCIGFENLEGLKPALVRNALGGLLRAECGLRRFVMRSTEAFHAVMSTMRKGDARVEELDVVFDPTVKNAAWLAFGLFHVDSNSSVTSLQLRLPPIEHGSQWERIPTQRWLAVFTRALQSIRGEQDLIDIGDRSNEQGHRMRRFVTIVSGTSVKTEAFKAAKQLCRIDDGAETFEVLAEVDAWIAVLVTGLGVGWVHAATVLSEMLLPSRLPSSSQTSTSGESPLPRFCQKNYFPAESNVRTNRRITSFVWDCTGDMLMYQTLVPLVMKLLVIIGEPLERLHLPLIFLSTPQLSHTLGLCPNLTELNVSGHRMNTIAPLVAAYANGHCHIETLSIAHIDTSIPGDKTAREMTTILRGPSAHKLRQLAIQLVPPLSRNDEDANDRIEATLALIQAVNQSTALEFVQLPGSARWERPGFGMETDGPEASLTLRVDVSANSFCISRMSSTSKHAFLSCVACADKTSALRRFDAVVLSRIFAFCDQAVARRVIMDAPLAFSLEG